MANVLVVSPLGDLKIGTWVPTYGHVGYRWVEDSVGHRFPLHKYRRAVMTHEEYEERLELLEICPWQEVTDNAANRRCSV